MQDKANRPSVRRAASEPELESLPSDHSMTWFFSGIAALVVYCVFSLAVGMFDVQPIGPEGSRVGFASFNGAVFAFFGESALWDLLSDLGAYAAFVVGIVFLVWGVCQWVSRRSFLAIDGDLRALLLLYGLMALFYLMFEIVGVNYRPVLEDGALEPSYPSSHTLFSACLLWSAAFVIWDHSRQGGIAALGIAAAVAVSLMVAIGRVFAGMHWATDVIGALVLALALVCLYRSLSEALSPVIKAVVA